MIPCATCGAPPIGTFNDGSPRYAVTCSHAPIRGEDGAESAGDGRVVVELSAESLAIGEECGKKRFNQSRRRKLRDKLFTPDLAANVIGAQGEVAFAQWLDVPFACTTGAYNGAPDVAGCQIKTRTKTSYELVVHEADPGRIPCVLVTAHPPRFWLRGWIFARDAKRPEWRSNPDGRREAWFVPTAFLRPMEELLIAARPALGLPPLSEIST